MRPRSVYASLLSIALLTIALRSLNLDNVFSSDGRILLDLHDASLHARRALFGFVNFPSVLGFDPYLNYPDGAPAPFPPLFDWLLAATARAFGESERIFLSVAAWSSPVLAAITVVPVFAMARITSSPTTALGAAAVFALLPMGVIYSGLGNCDHHAAVVLLASSMLALSMAATRAVPDLRRFSLLCLCLLLVRAALLLTWSGSLLYIGLGEGGLLIGACLSGQRRLWAGQAGGALGSALIVAPWVASSGVPLGGLFSATTLSWLHIVALGCVAGLCAGLFALEALWPSRGPGERTLRTALVGGLILSSVLVIPVLRSSLLPGAAFLAGADAWAGSNPEQRALFSSALAWRSPVELYGYFAYLIPIAALVPLGKLITMRAQRATLSILTTWTLVLGALALWQVRFGSDFAPAASIAFASLLAWIPARVPCEQKRARRLAVSAALIVGTILLWPAISSFHLARFPRALAHLRGSPLESASPRLTPKYSFVRFAEKIRAVTPETSGFFDPGLRPEYSILCPPTLGHALQFAARRPTPANNMGPYLDAEKFRLVRSFYRSESEQEAVAIAEHLGARFVLTAAAAGLRSPHLDYRLQRQDGSAPEEGEHLSHFRLVAEGPFGGRPLRLMYPRGSPLRVVPYKLFEIVEGALLRIAATPGSDVVAELRIETEMKRSFLYSARARADADGIAQIRVPFPTASNGSIQTGDAYRVRVGEHTRAVSVSEDDVRTGAAIEIAVEHSGLGGGLLRLPSPLPLPLPLPLRPGADGSRLARQK